ncbi:hypothetical protein Btru_072374 [Bulinus truncatus]|nr:hypothetical protein Btru_072374 [Bulinus truncatus]
MGRENTLNYFEQIFIYRGDLGQKFVYDFLKTSERTPGGVEGRGSEGRGSQMISDFTRDLFIVINHMVIDMCICILGIVGNCVNITVFVRQGLRRSVNLSLCAMSFSDLLGLVFQTWQNICLNPYMQETDAPVDFLMLQILTGGCPNILMIRITGWITMYITFERCLSVLIPLKIRRIITFERTVVILVFIFALNVSFFLLLYAIDYLSWEFNPSRNMTVLTLSVREGKELLDFIFNSAHFYLSIIAFVLVVIFTVVLVVNLKKRSQWRRGVTSDGEQQEALSKRENKAIGMVVAVSAVMIVCYAPGVLCSILTSVIDSFGFSGGQFNLHQMVWSFCFVFHSINSSINVILYFKMSSKYRTTAMEIFTFLKKKEKN